VTPDLDLLSGERGTPLAPSDHSRSTPSPPNQGEQRAGSTNADLLRCSGRLNARGARGLRPQPLRRAKLHPHTGRGSGPSPPSHSHGGRIARLPAPQARIQLMCPVPSSYALSQPPLQTTKAVRSVRLRANSLPPRICERASRPSTKNSTTPHGTSPTSTSTGAGAAPKTVPDQRWQ
jgi:hypothetical protein